MNIWQMVTWDVARAGGFTAFGLLTLSVAIGLALTLHIQSPRWPRIINSELHNFITLLALAFTGVHVLAVWVDPFTHFGWNEVLIPLASHYRPVWMALGIVALYIGIAIGLSTWLRPYIGYKWWRRLHVLTLVLSALVVIHGIAMGSDTRTGWGAAIYAISVLLIGTLLIVRLLKPATAQNRAHPVLAIAVAVMIAIAAFLCMLGPFQSGWNSIANNGNNSGSPTTNQVVPSQPKTSPRPALPQSAPDDEHQDD
jgi:predicted ferric reductase